MNTTTAPTPSVAQAAPSIRAELDAMIAGTYEIEARLDRIDAHIERQIAQLERMNPCQIEAMAHFADLAPQGWLETEDAPF